MDTMIRNLDERTYRELKARAALTGRTIGDTVNEAVRLHRARPESHARTGRWLSSGPTTTRRATRT
jgi:plasmid stability protein